MKIRRVSRRRAFSLAELCIAMVLMTAVMFLAVGLLNLATKAMLGSRMETTVVREDAEFAAKLNDTVRNAGTAFTIPKASFVREKLTKGWNYLGMMEGVHIPAFASRTGGEIASEKALVYIEYMGDLPPASTYTGANVLHTADGYFVQHVLSHSFTDVNGVYHDYDLIFNPTDPKQTAAQNITYDFTANLSKSGGLDAIDGKGIDIDTMLNALNAIQVVYRGSAVNPAVALAFRSDFLPTYSVTNQQTNKPAATVTMVLDVSGSMKQSFSGGTRLSALKTAAKDFVEKLSANDKINVCLVPFSSFAVSPRNGNLPVCVYNAANDKETLFAAIDNMQADGGTNVGDGLRRAYYESVALQASGTEMGKSFLILMTDGEMNMWNINGNSAADLLNFYVGSADVPPYIPYHSGNHRRFNVGSGSWWAQHSNYSGYWIETNMFSNYEDSANRCQRAYMRLFADRIMSEFSAEAYLISLCDGMPAGDKAALQAAFHVDEVFDVNSLTDFQNVFEQINNNINEVMWAFEGPRT